ncbi:MAG: MarR family transcriptional regulator [Enterococcus sp.]|jgi:DNA-binding MarR family transcriptional regulator|nr:MarR family transcriptional regulator [Enterococcus sp.]
MNNTELKKLLMNIPTKLCRNLNNEFIKSILKDLIINFSHQHYTILKLLEENKHLYVTEFVDILSITKPQMTSLIDKLVKMGYVNRTNDINDRRKIYISATQKGKMTISKINKTIDNKIDKHLFELTQKELEALENGLLILQKLCSNCSKDVV